MRIDDPYLPLSSGKLADYLEPRQPLAGIGGYGMFDREQAPTTANECIVHEPYAQIRDRNRIRLPWPPGVALGLVLSLHQSRSRRNSTDNPDRYTRDHRSRFPDDRVAMAKGQPSP